MSCHAIDVNPAYVSSETYATSVDTTAHIHVMLSCCIARGMYVTSVTSRKMWDVMDVTYINGKMSYISIQQSPVKLALPTNLTLLTITCQFRTKLEQQFKVG